MTLEEWLDTPEEEEGIPTGAPLPAPTAQQGAPVQKQTLGEWLDTPDPPELRASTGPRGKFEEPDVPTPGLVETYGPPALRMGGAVGGALLGGAIGGALGGIPGAVTGGRIGGGSGAALGEMGARYVGGQEQKVLPTVVAGIGGALLPGGAGTLREMAAKEALINAGIGMASETADTGKLPSGRNIPIAMILGAGGRVAGERLAPSRGSDVPIPQRGDIPLPPEQQPRLQPYQHGPELPPEYLGALPRFEEPVPAPALPDMPLGAAGPPRPGAPIPADLPPAPAFQPLPPGVHGPRIETTRTRIAPEAEVLPPGVAGPVQPAPQEEFFTPMLEGRPPVARSPFLDVARDEEGGRIYETAPREVQPLVTPSGDLLGLPATMPPAPRPTDIVQSGFPQRGASEPTMWETLGRRYLPQPEEIDRLGLTPEEVNKLQWERSPEIERIVAETAPTPAQSPRMPLEQPGPIITGGERTAGTEYLQRELGESAERFARGAEPEPLPVPGAVGKPVRGMIPEARPEDFDIPYTEKEAARLEKEPQPLFDQLKNAPLTAGERKVRPGMEQRSKMNDRIQESMDVSTVLSLRERFNTLEKATQHAYNMMEDEALAARELTEKRPYTARELLDAVDLANSDRRYRGIFNDQRTLSEILASEPKEGGRTLTDFLRGESGAAMGPLVRTVAGGGGGALVGGALPADTPEERMRNAALVGLAGAGLGAGGPALLSKIQGKGRAVPPTANAAEEALRSVGDKARQYDALRRAGDFDAAFDVADEAHMNVEKLLPEIQKITPNHRLYKVVHDTLVEPGPRREASEGAVSNAGRLLQRYSDLAKKLRAEAEAGDQDAGKLYDTLFGRDTATPFSNFMNFWRGSLTGRIPTTALRNAADQGTVIATSALDKQMTGVMEGIATGYREGEGVLGKAQGVLQGGIRGGVQGAREAYDLGAAATSRAWQGFSELTHLAAKEPDKLEKAINHFEAMKQSLAKPEGLEGVTEGGKKAAAWANKYLNGINSANNLQEQYFRRLTLEASLTSQLREAGIDAQQAFANPQLIPEHMVEKAINEALTNTFQNTPKSGTARSVARFWAENPALYGIAPFPRYVSNRMQYFMERSPLGVIRFATQGRQRNILQGKLAAVQDEFAKMPAGQEVGRLKAQHKIDGLQKQIANLDTPAQIMGKLASGGLFSLVAGATLRSEELRGDHWWEVKAGDKMIDMRPFASVAGFMFMGELARQVYFDHKISMSGLDFAQGVALLGLRSGVGLTALDYLGGQKPIEFDGVMNLAADLAGTFGAGLFNPISPLKDVAGYFSPEEAKMRDTRDTPLQRLYGPSVNQIPFLRSEMLPASASPTRGEGKSIEFPGAHLLGVNAQTRTPLEKEVARLQLDPASLTSREQRKEDARAITWGAGQAAEQYAQRLLQNPRYKGAPEPEQRIMLRDFFQSTRDVGKSKLPRARQYGIDFRRQSPDMQEIMKRRGRAPVE